MAYLYTYIGKPWKTQAIVHRVLDSLYHTGHEGLPGNEDCGQMSAWYVWSALGLYPVTPGGSGYAISSPLFERAIIRLENGKTLEIRANKPSAKSLYLKSLRWNSKPYDLNLISFDLLKNGGLLEAQLSEKPNLNRGRTLVKGEKNEDNGFIKAPFIQTDSRFFADSASVVLSHPEKLPIRYRLNDDKSQTFSYSKPFCIRENTRISAWAVAGDNESGKAIGSFYRLPHTGWEIKLLSKPNRQYSAEGPKSLIDGIEGLGDWRKGDWLGFQERDMEVIFQFGKEESIGRIRPGFLQDTRSWILMPQQFSVEFSLDGQQWSAPQVLNINLDPKEMNSKILRPELRSAPVKAGWMRFRAKQFGKLPEWHPGAGGDSFIFCDEIEVFEQ
jgi:hypothetical protein